MKSRRYHEFFFFSKFSFSKKQIYVDNLSTTFYLKIFNTIPGTIFLEGGIFNNIPCTIFYWNFLTLNVAIV